MPAIQGVINNPQLTVNKEKAKVWLVIKRNDKPTQVHSYKVKLMSRKHKGRKMTLYPYEFKPS